METRAKDTDEAFRCLGLGLREKKIAFISVKVYVVALYVEAEKAARELGVRDRGGFFKEATDGEYCDALLDGAFEKVLRLQLVRDVDGPSFTAAIEERLAPRMQLTGSSALLEQFEDCFLNRKLSKGSLVLLMWAADGTLRIVVREGGTAKETFFEREDAKIESASFCRALFEVFLGSDPPSPAAHAQWAAGARQLLASDQITRSTRKGGSG